jgi:fructose-1,6-bisphosphatase II
VWVVRLRRGRILTGGLLLSRLASRVTPQHGLIVDDHVDPRYTLGMQDRNLALEVVRVTERAALAAARLMGRGDRYQADQVAVDAMRAAFGAIDVRGTVVISEGARANHPKFVVMEQVGAGWHNGNGASPKVDIAIDPLEGTNLCATGAPDAISVIALADDGRFLNAPDVYMDKIAVGPEAADKIDLRQPVSWNLKRIAEAKHKSVQDVTAIILDRPRHDDLIGEARQAGARIRLIGDGDVAAAVMTCYRDSGIDVLFGAGGAPEGVIAAAALRCMGGAIHGRLNFKLSQPATADERERVRKMDFNDQRIYLTDELAEGDVMFAATGVTKGYLLDGVRFLGDSAKTESIVMRSKTRTVRVINATHRLASN